MAKKIFTYRGKTMNELITMSYKEFMELLPARERRSLKRLTKEQKIALDNIEKKKNVKTHCRELIILPQMVGKTIQIHRGNSFDKITIMEEMLGHRLGEFIFTRKKLTHSDPGLGATRSSAFASTK